MRHSPILRNQYSHRIRRNRRACCAFREPTGRQRRPDVIDGPRAREGRLTAGTAKGEATEPAPGVPKQHRGRRDVDHPRTSDIVVGLHDAPVNDRELPIRRIQNGPEHRIKRQRRWLGLRPNATRSRRLTLQRRRAPRQCGLRRCRFRGSVQVWRRFRLGNSAWQCRPGNGRGPRRDRRRERGRRHGGD